MKIYSLYEKMKGEDNSKFYLFRVGIFYMFLDDDAYYISKITNLKLYYDGLVYKCYFSINELKDYLLLFKYECINVELIDNIYDDITSKYNDIFMVINNIDVNKICSRNALKVIYELKEIVSYE